MEWTVFARLPALVLVAAALFMFCGAVPAEAATGSVDGSAIRYGDGGQRIDVSIAMSVVQTMGAESIWDVRTTVLITDRAAVPVAGAGCEVEPADPSTLRCSYAKAPERFQLLVTGSGGPDAVAVAYDDSVRRPNVTIDLGAGNDTVDISTLAQLSVYDCFSQCTDPPTITPSDGDDTFYWCSCHTGLPDGGAGTDTVSGARATGAQGYGISVLGGSNIEMIIGSPYDDHVHDDVAVPYIDLGAGADKVDAAAVNQVINLGEGPDVFTDHAPTTAAQTVAAGPGKDIFIGTSTSFTRGYSVICLDRRTAVCGLYDGRVGEHDRLGPDIEYVRIDGEGNDLLIGSPNTETLIGGGGDDVLMGGGGPDLLQGGRGFDFADYGYRPLQPRAIKASLDGRRNDAGPPRDLIGSDVEGIGGSVFNDTLVAGATSSGLYGNAGNDVLRGGGEPDYLDGGKGNDRIEARHGGRDEVHCGGGRDRVRADAKDEVAADCEVVERT